MEVLFGYPRLQGSMRLPGAFRRLPRPSSTSEPSHPPESLACRAPLRALAKFVPMGEILCMAVNAVRVYRGCRSALRLEARVSQTAYG